MKNQRLRQKKLARHKKRKEQSNKSYDARKRCEYGAYKTKRQAYEYEKIYNKIKLGFDIP